MTRDELREREEINLAAMIADLAMRLGVTIAVAESLTNGHVSARLGDARGSRQWFGGGIVADSEPVRRGVLHVRAACLVSEQAAGEMARAVREMLGADLAVAVAGGDAPGRTPGTVCFAIADRDGVIAETRHFASASAELAADAAAYALTLVRRRLTANWQRRRHAS